MDHHAKIELTQLTPNYFQIMQWRYMKELPPGLRAGAKCRPLTVGDAYNTTTGYTYRTRERNMTTPTAWPEHKKAPGHWKVYYTKHTIDKVFLH